MSAPQGFGFTLRSLVPIISFTVGWSAVEITTLFFLQEYPWWIHYHIFTYGSLANFSFLAIAYLTRGLTGNPALMAPRLFIFLNIGSILAVAGSITSELVAPSKEVTLHLLELDKLTLTGRLLYSDTTNPWVLGCLLVTMLGMLCMAGTVMLLFTTMIAGRTIAATSPTGVHFVSVLKSLELSCMFFVLSLALDFTNGVMFFAGFHLPIAGACVVSIFFGWCTIPFVSSTIVYAPIMLTRAPQFDIERMANRYLPLMAYAMAFLIVGMPMSELMAPYDTASVGRILVMGIPTALLSVCIVATMWPIFKCISWKTPTFYGWLITYGCLSMATGTITLFVESFMGQLSTINLPLSIQMYGIRAIVVALVVYIAQAYTHCAFEDKPLIPLIQMTIYVTMSVLYFLGVQEMIELPSWFRMAMAISIVGALFGPWLLGVPRRTSLEMSAYRTIIVLMQEVLDGPAQKERIYTAGPNFSPIDRRNEDEPAHITIYEDSKTKPFTESLVTESDSWLPVS